MMYHRTRSQSLREGSLFHILPELARLSVEGLYSSEVEASASLPLGLVTLSPGQAIPLHINDCAEAIYVMSGTVSVTRGAGSAEIQAPSAAYFPAGVPHAIAAVGDEPSSFLLSCSRAQRPNLSGNLLDPQESLAGYENPNEIRGSEPLFRWAVTEDFEPWLPVEPTKGWRLRMKFLLDPRRGTPEFVIGVAEATPNTHYTIHQHAPAEFYHVLEGSGTIYVGDESYSVKAGDTVYVPENVPHGFDTQGDQLRTHWAYGVEGIGDGWVWRACESIYTNPR